MDIIMEMEDPHLFEEMDAKLVDEAVKFLRAGDVALALALLNEVITRTPESYVHEYEKDGKLYIKFWDQREFMHYVTTLHPKQDVMWVPNAYPRAYYYLGLIMSKQGDYQKAILMLDTSSKLEPDNPYVMNELAKVFASLRNSKLAISMYDLVINADPPAHEIARAVALRGKAVQLIELGKIDDAEHLLKESLRFEPNNKVALNELEYIRRLRAGQPTTSAQTILSVPTSEKLCASCNKLVSSGHVYNVKGRVLYLCDGCYQKITSKRKWEFWK